MFLASLLHTAYSMQDGIEPAVVVDCLRASDVILRPARIFIIRLIATSAAFSVGNCGRMKD